MDMNTAGTQMVTVFGGRQDLVKGMVYRRGYIKCINCDRERGLMGSPPPLRKRGCHKLFFISPARGTCLVLLYIEIFEEKKIKVTTSMTLENLSQRKNCPRVLYNR